MGEGGREETSAVNDYRCKMAVCWTEYTGDLGLVEKNGWGGGGR